MKIRDNIAIFLIGCMAATAFHSSCDDDGSPPPADAAVECDCPAAEPPLAARLMRVTAQREIAPMTADGLAAACELGWSAISGGCKSGTIDSKHLMNSSFPVPQETPVGWACRFYNGTASPVTSEAYVLCLKPAS